MARHRQCTIEFRASGLIRPLIFFMRQRASRGDLSAIFVRAAGGPPFSKSVSMIQTIEQALEAADIAQQKWVAEIPRDRLRRVGKVAGLLAERYAEFLPAIERPNASDAEKLSSEIIPLADACRFTAAVGRRTLAPRASTIRRGAWWLGRMRVVITREAWGTVLILAPCNYPLFLPGVQIVQALAAGNAVMVKPAPGGSAVVELFKRCLIDAGFPAELIQILPTSIEAGQAAMRQGVDKVVLTGSIHTGRAVLRELAETLTPATMELSGCDAVFVLPQADIARAARAVAFGLQLNGGATCIAPRRLFVAPESQIEFVALLTEELQSTAPVNPAQIAATAIATTHRTAQQALAKGAEVLLGTVPELNDKSMRPLILRNVTADMEIARSDLFAPVACLMKIDSMESALAADRRCPYSLGAAVFGPQSNAELMASQIAAGCVVVNDMIAPTADPRVSFGGRDQSGWGVTRGIEGLLEMTRPKTVCTRHGNWLPHLNPKNARDTRMLSLLLQVLHAPGLRPRWRALRAIIQHTRSK